jgi:hypothetical protein
VGRGVDRKAITINNNKIGDKKKIGIAWKHKAQAIALD